jgi:hypothetical protein
MLCFASCVSVRCRDVVTWLQSVPQFRLAFNSYLERSGMASSDDFQELADTADEETEASFAEGKRMLAVPDFLRCSSGFLF